MINQRRFITALVMIALFAAWICAGSFIAIPVGPVPIALQNFFTLLAGLVLGPFLGTGAVGLFIVAGAIGLPVYANNTMGIAILMGPTGGYLFGYLLSALVAGLVIGFPKQGEKIKRWRLVLAAVLGILVVYIPGLIRLNNFLDTWPKTFAAGFYPFLIGDAIKGVIAALIVPRLRKAASRQITNNNSHKEKK
jgi:biotin transport system substrate-specific component